MEHQESLRTKAATASGTLLSIAGNLGVGDLMKTMILAAVGAAASFCVSHLLQWVVWKIKQRSK